MLFFCLFLFLMSHVQSGPHIQQAVGMLGLIPGYSLGGKGGGGQMEFSFQADGREQCVLPALLWEVKEQRDL